MNDASSVPSSPEDPASGKPEASRPTPDGQPGENGRGESGTAADTEPESTPHAATERAARSAEAGEFPPAGPSKKSTPQSASAAEQMAASEATGCEAVEDELPEFEPLTPELVEDEAIRGDFMLRWVVVLLALLLGATQIDHPAVLRHVRTGQYQWSHGVLPPRTDVFSLTVQGRPWASLPWVYDLFVGAIGSATPGLTLLVVAKAALVGLAFYWLVHIGVPELPSWWGSICAAFALLATLPHFTGLPETLTVLFLAFMLWRLERWRFLGDRRGLVWLVPLFWLWANADPQWFVGGVTLVAYAAGWTLSRWLGATGGPETAGTGTDPQGERPATRELWTLVGLSLAVTLLHPFAWQTWLNIGQYYGTELPHLRQYLGADELWSTLLWPLYDRVVWTPPSAAVLAGCIVLLAALVTSVLNRRELCWGRTAAWLAPAALSILCTRELAAAAVVAAVAANINGQQWYRRTFRQSYSVEWTELLFSRGGRAVTVLGFFLVAVAAIGGHLAGPDAYRIGFGLSKRLAAHATSLQEVLRDSFDDRGFHFRLEQGDLLIWIGRPSFVDSRVALFAQTPADDSGSESLLELHNRMRYSLRRPPADAAARSGPAARWMGDASIYRPAFDRFRISHVLPRLHGARPDYETFFDLLTSQEFRLTALGAATAVFHWKDSPNAALQKYCDAHRLDLGRAAFETAGELPTPRPHWPRPPGVYAFYLRRPESTPNNDIQAGRHLATMLTAIRSGFLQVPPDFAFGVALLAIDRANRGLALDPEDPVGFRVLAAAHRFLGELERAAIASSGTVLENRRRYYQAVLALQQSLICDPDDLPTRLELFDLYYGHQKKDLALQALDQYLQASRRLLGLADPSARQIRARLNQLRPDLERAVAEMRKTVAAALEKENADRVQIAMEAYQAGFVLQALDALGDDPFRLAQDVFARYLRAVLLLESGQVEEAAELFDSLETDPAASDLAADWQTFSAWLWTAIGDYARGIRLLDKTAEHRRRLGLTAVVATAPMAAPPVAMGQTITRLWPLPHTAAIANLQTRVRPSVMFMLWENSLSHLESRQLQPAILTLQRMLAVDPETPLRPLAAFYLTRLTGEPVDPQPPSARIPFEKPQDVFAPSGEEGGSDSGDGEAER